MSMRGAIRPDSMAATTSASDARASWPMSASSPAAASSHDTGGGTIRSAALHYPPSRRFDGVVELGLAHLRRLGSLWASGDQPDRLVRLVARVAAVAERFVGRFVALAERVEADFGLAERFVADFFAGAGWGGEPARVFMSAI